MRIFKRGPSGYELTAIGKSMVELASDMDERIGGLERQLAGSDPRVEGEVRITTVASIAWRLRKDLLEFKRSFPAVRLCLHVSNDMVSLAKGDADIAVRVTKVPPAPLVGRKLVDVRFAVYGAGHILPAERGDIHEMEWVCLDASRAQTPQARWEMAHVDPAKVSLRTNSSALFGDAVSAGIGIGILPLGVGSEDPNLVALTEPMKELTLPLWLLTHEELRDTPRVRAVLDFLADVVGRSRERF